jgi:hypothetical protein
MRYVVPSALANMVSHSGVPVEVGRGVIEAVVDDVVNVFDGAGDVLELRNSVLGELVLAVVALELGKDAVGERLNFGNELEEVTIALTTALFEMVDDVIGADVLDFGGEFVLERNSVMLEVFECKAEELDLLDKADGVEVLVLPLSENEDEAEEDEEEDEVEMVMLDTMLEWLVVVEEDVVRVEL